MEQDVSRVDELDDGKIHEAIGVLEVVRDDTATLGDEKQAASIMIERLYAELGI